MDGIVERLRAAGCVFAEDEARLLVAEAGDADELERMVVRRVAGDPLEVIVGWAEFCGLRIPVSAGVFVPRRRTELLAQQAVSRVRCGSVVVELCCGAGAVSAVLLAACEGLEVHAADIDPVAVACARGHLEPQARVHAGDLYAALPERLRGHVDVVIANAPYVPTAEVALLPREAREHEPPVALDGGGDGLQIARRIAQEAVGWLAPGGSLLVECSEAQAELLGDVMARRGLRPSIVTDAETGTSVVIGEHV